MRLIKQIVLGLAVGLVAVSLAIADTGTVGPGGTVSLNTAINRYTEVTLTNNGDQEATIEVTGALIKTFKIPAKGKASFDGMFRGQKLILTNTSQVATVAYVLKW